MSQYTHPKTIKFRPYLVPLVLSGEKYKTWRMFDDKNFQVGDIVSLLNWVTLEEFGEAQLTDVYEKKVCDMAAPDFVGHEPFETKAEMVAKFREYYGDSVNENTLVKIITFSLI